MKDKPLETFADVRKVLALGELDKEIAEGDAAEVEGEEEGEEEEEEEEEELGEVEEGEETETS